MRVFCIRRDPVHPSKDNTREHKGHVDDHKPHQFVVAINRIGLWDAGFHESFEKVDGRDRNNRRDQLHLQAEKVDSAHPIRFVLLIADIHFGHEVLIARKQHDQQKVRGQGQIDERQHDQN